MFKVRLDTCWFPVFRKAGSNVYIWSHCCSFRNILWITLYFVSAWTVISGICDIVFEFVIFYKYIRSFELYLLCFFNVFCFYDIIYIIKCTCPIFERFTYIWYIYMFIICICIWNDLREWKINTNTNMVNGVVKWIIYWLRKRNFSYVGVFRVLTI